MIKQTKKQLFILAAIAATALSATTASAQTPPVTDIIVDGGGVIPYVIDARKVVARSGFGLCWRTGYWTPALAENVLLGNSPGNLPVGCECDGDLMPANRCVIEAPKQVEMPVSPAPAPVAQKIKLSADALFDFDKAILKPEGKQRLSELAAQARQINLEVILATGHTDRIGSDKYNQGLSERRAAAVKAYLVEQGVEASRIYTEGKGETMPVTGDSCKNGLGRKALVNCLQPDRRVEVEVIGTRAQ